MRDVLRFLLGFCFSLGFALAFDAQVVGIIGLVSMFVLWKILMKNRAKRKLHDCDGCPELKSESICSGFQAQAQASRLYEEQASTLVNQSWTPSEHIVQKLKK